MIILHKDLEMKKILVTGGLGYIGSHVVVELQNNNFEVLIVDDLSNSSLKVLDGIQTEVETRFSAFEIQTNCNRFTYKTTKLSYHSETHLLQQH